ncbi:hypothetical protein MJ585_28055 [Klebsiella pneumoniae]|nr:hypothetical protein MJ585_28055 [Klebsiella pneumoniae]
MKPALLLVCLIHKSPADIGTPLDLAFLMPAHAFPVIDKWDRRHPAFKRQCQIERIGAVNDFPELRSPWLQSRHPETPVVLL